MGKCENSIFPDCFDIFTKLHGMSSDNFKYVKYQFYRKVSRVSHGCTKTTQVTTHKHRYQTVSIPKIYTKAPKFQQKGIIFIWPQRRKFYHIEEITLFTWLLAHALFWLNTMYLLPNGAVLPVKQPPWIYRPPLRRPEYRDYIIEPDWDSGHL
ncbi:hypothetical protein NQ318_018133 [Aromia moschata]|uniref:Uncharacterized protein n=1 Tax=Aromia moschata TaxID=1265417 RepID=A0AAV8ZES2_9CUCU|nr:hypothetical protein NQ318_018133 [Aromia moschata]